MFLLLYLPTHYFLISDIYLEIVLYILFADLSNSLIASNILLADLNYSYIAFSKVFPGPSYSNIFPIFNFRILDINAFPFTFLTIFAHPHYSSDFRAFSLTLICCFSCILLTDLGSRRSSVREDLYYQEVIAYYFAIVCLK